MLWNDEVALELGHSDVGAIWWGAFEALNQWTCPVNPNRPNVRRPTDHELVSALEEGPFTASMLQAFAKEYKVFRYPLNPLPSREARLRDVALALDEVYRGATNPTPAKLAQLWWAAVERVRDVIEQYQMRPTLLRSFCMKSLWFYYPEQATMWDSHAVRALNLRFGTRHVENIKRQEQTAAFLQDFEQLFSDFEQEITDALSIANQVTGQAYSHGRRVLDKALWLKGCNNNDRVLQAILSLEADPVRRQAMEQRFPMLIG